MTRRPDDAYDTPPWCVHRLLDAWGELLLPHIRPASILEPFAGAGSLVRAVNSWMAQRGYEPPSWVTVDVAPRCDVHLARDYMSWSPPVAFDLLATNPPYKIAFSAVQKAVEGGEARELVYLLPLTFLASRGRSEWLTQHTPDILVLPDRPSFTGDGKTMATDYAWFHWRHGEQWKLGSIDFAALTPKEERR
jgi:hypothetical protein